MNNHINPTEIACANYHHWKNSYTLKKVEDYMSITGQLCNAFIRSSVYKDLITLSLSSSYMREMMELGCGPWLDYDQCWSVVQGSQTRHESPRSINKRAVSSNCLTELLTHNTSTCDHQIRIMNSQLCR